MNLEMLHRILHRGGRLVRASEYDHQLVRFGHDGQMYQTTDRCWHLKKDGEFVCLLWQTDILVKTGSVYRSAI